MYIYIYQTNIWALAFFLSLIVPKGDKYGYFQIKPRKGNVTVY